MPYFEKVRENFAHRQELGLDELLAEFGLPAEVSEEDLLRALYVFEEEYLLDLGLLRGTDPMRIFLTAPRSSNPLTWVREREQFLEVVWKLGDHVNDSRYERGLEPPPKEPDTLREYVAYCTGVEDKLGAPTSP